MKKIATIISVFGILGISQAQLSVGSAGMNIKSGTVVSTQGETFSAILSGDADGGRMDLTGISYIKN